MSDRNLDQARAIVAKAIEFDAWTWDDPAMADNEQEVMNTAEQLVRAAVTASEKGLIADAVVEILRVAGEVPRSDATRAAYAARFGEPAAQAQAQPAQASGTSAFAQSASPPAAPSATPGASSPEQAPPVAAGQPAGEMPSIEDIFPGYDSLKAKEIKDAILSSAASGDLTEEEWLRIRAYEAANDERATILNLKPEFKQPEPEPTVVDTMAAGAFAQPAPTTSTAQAPGGEDLQTTYNGETLSRAQQEGLPIPPKVDFQQSLPVLPADITTTSDQDLSRIATQFHNCFVRAEWLRSQEEGRERAAEQLEQDAHRGAFAQALAHHESAIPSDKRTGTALENARRAAGNDADAAEAVHVWRSRKVQHGIEARELKALAVGYDKAVWRINEELDRRARLATTARAAS